MHLIVQPYPERITEHPKDGLEIEVFRPEFPQVVMGASGKYPQEVFPETMQAEGVPLYKRKGGGGTVVLSRQTIVVTLHAHVAHRFRNLAYFKAVNAAMSRVFHQWMPLDYGTRGISDIAVDGRKIVGTSVFRRRQYLLYQASIIVELNIDLIAKLLRHPPKEPDYRKGRDHRSFLTSLRELGIDHSYDRMIADLHDQMPGFAREHLAMTDASKEDEELTFPLSP